MSELQYWKDTADTLWSLLDRLDDIHEFSHGDGQTLEKLRGKIGQLHQKRHLVLTTDGHQLWPCVDGKGLLAAIEEREDSHSIQETHSKNYKPVYPMPETP